MDKQERAAQELAQQITARQTGRTPLTRDALEPEMAEFADELLRLSETLQPDPAFVAELDATLQKTIQSGHARAWPDWRQNAVDAWRRWAGLPWGPLRLAVAGAVLTLLLALLVAVPTTLAALRSLLFGLAFTAPETIAEQIIAVETPVEAASGRPMTLDEIRTLAPFVVQTPTWLPDGLDFTGGYVVQTRTGAQVSLVYHRPQDRTARGALAVGTPALLLVITSGEPEAPPLLPETEQQWVDVRGNRAVYVHGGWRAGVVDKDAATIADVVWDTALDGAWLTWQQDDLIYWMQADGLGFEMSTMVQIAEVLANETGGTLNPD